MIKLKNLLEDTGASKDWESSTGKYERTQYIKFINKIVDIVNKKLQEYVKIDAVAKGATPLKYDGGKEETYYPQQGDIGFTGPDTWKEWKWSRSVKVGDSAIGEKGPGVTEDQYAEIMMYGPQTQVTALSLKVDREVAKHKGIAARLKGLWRLVTQGYTQKAKHDVPVGGKKPAYAQKFGSGGGFVSYHPTVEPGTGGDLFSANPEQIADEIFDQLKVAFMPIEVLRKSTPEMEKFLDDPKGWSKWNPIV